MEIIEIETDYIKLEQLLKFAGIADSGSFAKQMILDGLVKYNGLIELQRGKKVRAGDIVEAAGETLKVANGGK